MAKILFYAVNDQRRHDEHGAILIEDSKKK